MRFVVATAVSNLVTVLFVSTYALSMLYGTSFTALFISRIPQYIVTTGVCAVIAFSLYYSVVTMMINSTRWHKKLESFPKVKEKH